MLMLEELARSVVEHWADNSLAEHVRALMEHLQQIDADREKYADFIGKARTLYAGIDLEFDDMPLVSSGADSDGAFINAWVWIHGPDA